MSTSSTTTTGRPPESSTCPVHAHLDAWARHVWCDGVQIDTLRDLDMLHVRTRNTVYEITVIDAARGTVLVRGGRFFPIHTQVLLSGSSLGGAFLKLKGVYPGFCMELQCGRTRIVTTSVQAVAVKQADEASIM
jgi:hypothetical protein